MRPEERPMTDAARRAKLVSKSAVKSQWLLVASALLFGAHPACAQGGSAGGTIGQPNKSISSGQDVSARSLPVKKPKPSGSASGTLAAVGTWNGVSTGGCIPNWSWTLQVSSEGIITGSGTTGRVGRGGAGNGTMTVLGKDYHFAGHFGPKEGSGTWKRTDGCTGSWTGTKS
jgi:hypothetical protein